MTNETSTRDEFTGQVDKLETEVREQITYNVLHGGQIDRRDIEAAKDVLHKTFDAQDDYITEMKAGLDHIIKWSKQSQELLGKGQLMRAVRRMCYDTLGKGK